MSITVAEGVHGAGPTATTTAIVTTLLSSATGSAGLLAVSLLAEEGIGALAAAPATAIITALLAGAIGLTDLLFALTGVALESRLTRTATTATAIITALLTCTVRLTTARVRTLVIFTTLPFWTSAATSATAITATNLPVTIRNTGTALTAVQGLDIDHALIVPFGFTAPGILGTNALLHSGVIAAAIPVRAAAITRPRTGTAITGADLAGLTTVAFAITTNRVVAPTTAAA